MIFPGQITHPRRVMHSVTGFPFTSGLMVQTGRKSQ